MAEKNWYTAADIQPYVGGYADESGWQTTGPADRLSTLTSIDSWIPYARALGFEGPTKTQVLSYDPGEGGGGYVEVTSPEFKQFVDRAKGAGYELVISNIHNRRGEFGLMTPGGEVVGQQKFDTGNFGTLLRDLAPMALTALTFGGGAASLGAAVAPTASTTAQLAIGNALISGGTTAIGGGDLGDVAKAAALAGAAPYVTQALSPALQSVSESLGGGTLGATGAGAVSGAVRGGIGALAQGQNPFEGALTGGVTGGVTAGSGALTGQMDLPEPIERAAGAALASEILGGDTARSATNALLGALPAYAGDVARRPDTGDEEGFFDVGGPGYDSWGREEHVFDPTYGGTLPLPEPALEPFFPEFEGPLLTDQTVMPPSPTPGPFFEEPYLTAPPVPEPAPPPVMDQGAFLGENIPTGVPEWDQAGAVAGLPIGNLEQDFVIDERGNVRDTAGNMGEFIDGDWVVREDPRDFINLPPAFTAPPAAVAPPAPPPAAVSPPAAVAPAPAPAPRSGMNMAALLPLLASMGFQEDDTPAPYQVAQIPVKSPFGLMYGMDESGPYGMRG